jgi:serine/threonine protein kinase
MPIDGASPADVEAIEHEIRMIKGLRHPNIVRYLGTETCHSGLHIFLEYAHGGSLRQLLQAKEHAPLPESVAATYTRQVLSGLAYLHAHGITHRDIKGANVLLASEGHCKLADFGASKRVEAHSVVSGLKGTPHWMAPEVIKGLQTPQGWPKADVWSVGCTAVEMLTGRAPWPQYPNPMAAMYRIASGEAPPLDGADENLSPEAVLFVASCCAQDPSARPDASHLLGTHPWLQAVAGNSEATAAATVNAPAVFDTSSVAAKSAAAVTSYFSDRDESALTTKPGLNGAIQPGHLHIDNSILHPMTGDNHEEDEVECYTPPSGSPIADATARVDYESERQGEMPVSAAADEDATDGHDRWRNSSSNSSSQRLEETASLSTAEDSAVVSQHERRRRRRRKSRSRKSGCNETDTSRSRRADNGATDCCGGIGCSDCVDDNSGRNGISNDRRNMISNDDNAADGSSSGINRVKREAVSESRHGLSEEFAAAKIDDSRDALQAVGLDIDVGSDQRPRGSKGRRSHGQTSQHFPLDAMNSPGASDNRPSHPAVKSRVASSLQAADHDMNGFIKHDAVSSSFGVAADAQGLSADLKVNTSAAEAHNDENHDSRRQRRRSGRASGSALYQSKTPGAKEHRLYAPERTQTTLEFTSQLGGQDASNGIGSSGHSGGSGEGEGNTSVGGAEDAYARPSGAASGQLRKLDFLLSLERAASHGSGHAIRQAAAAELGSDHEQRLYHPPDKMRYSKSTGTTLLPPLLDGGGVGGGSAAASARMAPLGASLHADSRNANIGGGGLNGGGSFSRAQLPQRHIASAPSALIHANSHVHASLQALPPNSGLAPPKMLAPVPLRNSSPTPLTEAPLGSYLGDGNCRK